MITVENLTKSFQGVNALNGVTLDVEAGTVLGVVGPSGAGKSTLARCVALLERPDSGAIRVDGTDITSLDGSALRAARRQIGVVPQGDSLLRQRTAAGNIVAAGRNRPARAFEFRTIGQLAAIGRRTGVARILGVNFSGFFAWWLWRTIYLSKLPRLEKKIRVAIDWTLDLVFPKDFVQFLTVRAPAVSSAAHEDQPPAAEDPTRTRRAPLEVI